ncbi:MULTISPECIES: hypothetical protein [unclassified Pseudomonas]|nr:MULTISPECIES: hypothetical protein [unclassified Pseudomonas]
MLLSTRELGESIWLATVPMDMRSGTDTVLARVFHFIGCVPIFE